MTGQTERTSGFGVDLLQQAAAASAAGDADTALRLRRHVAAEGDDVDRVAAVDDQWADNLRERRTRGSA